MNPDIIEINKESIEEIAKREERKVILKYSNLTKLRTVYDFIKTINKRYKEDNKVEIWVRDSDFYIVAKEDNNIAFVLVETIKNLTSKSLDYSIYNLESKVMNEYLNNVNFNNLLLTLSAIEDMLAFINKSFLKGLDIDGIRVQCRQFESLIAILTEISEIEKDLIFR